MRVSSHTFIVIGMEHYNPLGVIRTLGECGIRPVYIAIKHKCELASLSKYIERVHYVDSCEEAYELLMSVYGDVSPMPFVLTTDDDIQSLIDQNWSEVKGRFIAFNAGEDGRTTAFMDKKLILECAERNGLKVLDTVVTNRGVVPAGVDYPIITKSISPNDGGWKSDVFICENEQELRKAFESIQSKKVLIQKFVEKSNEICVDGYSVNRGRDLFMPMYTTYNYNIKGYYSPYMTVHGFDLVDLDAGMRAMFKEIGFEGVFSAEFLVDQDGAVYFSEINFRNSTWSYAATTLGMPIALLWAESTLTGSIPASYYKPIPDDYTAMVEPIDYGKRVLEGNTSLADWLNDYRNAGCLYYQSKSDPEPFKAMLEHRDLLS
ncbi:biotin carboxylase [Paraeggerthella hongkongensis]|nr:biotin carboxylase [Paraeggerthella hongkongensis]